MQAPETAITIDIEWAHPEVVADIVRLLDERGLRATFFCTHAGIAAPGHERAIHPNFRLHRNSLLPELRLTGETNQDFYRSIVTKTRAFCPEAVGVRAHSLFYDWDLLKVYRDAGLRYDSSYFLPLAGSLHPVWMGSGILELPLYYMDFWDLREQATGFHLGSLRLDEPGLKVVDFHPNLVYANLTEFGQYEDMKKHYHDPEQLLKNRQDGRGVRVLFLELLDRLARGPAPPVLAGVNERWRAEHR